jgi:hypothetical protein
MGKVSSAVIIISVLIILWGLITLSMYTDYSGADYSFGTGVLKGSYLWGCLMVVGGAFVGSRVYIEADR